MFKILGYDKVYSTVTRMTIIEPGKVYKLWAGSVNDENNSFRVEKVVAIHKAAYAVAKQVEKIL